MRRQIYLRFCGATYLRRSQRYEKSSAEANACLFLPRRSIYGASQSTKSRAQKQTHVCFCRDGVSTAQAKVRKVERRSKRMFDSAETEYLRRKPKYEKSSAEANACLILPRRSIYGASQSTKSRAQKQTHVRFCRGEVFKVQPKRGVFGDEVPPVFGNGLRVA